MSASASLRRIATLRNSQLITRAGHLERIAGSQTVASFRPLPRLLSTAKTPTVVPATVPPAVRLEELRRADLPAYPRYVAPKVPVTEVKDVLAAYEGKMENGTKDESKKITLSGTPFRGLYPIRAEKKGDPSLKAERNPYSRTRSPTTFCC